MSKKREILKKVSSVPTLPEVVMQLRELCNDEDVGYGKIAKVIERDPALTASLLRLANSAYFGGAGKISSVQFAMTRLGLKRVYQMALTVSLAPIATVELSGYGMDPHQLWEHSLATAMLAEQLTQDITDVDAGDAYTAGLLHDLGKVVMSTFVDVDKEAIRDGLDEGLAFDEAEHAALGADHADIAGALLKRWQVPSPVYDAVRWHHRPAKCESCPRLADVIHVADVLCLNAGWGLGSDDGLRYRMDDGATDRLGLDTISVERVVAAVMMDIEEIMSLFMVPQEA